MKDYKVWFIRWLPALALMVLIFFLSSIPPHYAAPSGGGLTLPAFSDQVQEFVVKKVSHLVIYGLLANIFWWGLTHGGKNRQPCALVLALVLTVLYGVTDEWHQSFVVGRYGSAFDVGVDTVGACLGLSWHLLSFKQWTWLPI